MAIVIIGDTQIDSTACRLTAELFDECNTNSAERALPRRNDNKACQNGSPHCNSQEKQNSLEQNKRQDFLSRA